MLFERFKFMNIEGGEPASGGDSVVSTPASTPDSVPAADPAITNTVINAADPAPAKGVWPEDWRDRLSSNDEKRKNIASRFTSPEAVFDALINAQDKIRSGNLKEVKPFPEKGTPEQQAAWRKENNLPEAPEKYDLNGLTVGEADKPFIDEFLKTAHTLNMNNQQAAKAIDWYFKSREAQMEAQDEADRTRASEVQEMLRQEWGGDYKANKTRIESLLDTAPPGVKDNLINARYPDGSAVFNDPNVLKFLAGLQMQIDPAVTLVGGTGNQLDMIGDEIAKMEKRMSEDRKGWFKDEAAQKRYRELINARDHMNRKAS